jgi:hypothetical protein
MTKDTQDIFVVKMQQNNNNKIISTFETVIFCFKCFEKKLQVDLWCIIVAF